MIPDFSKPHLTARLAPWLILSCYFITLCLLIGNHEPWFDEVQSWLIARDSSLYELLTHVLRYEGHPPLWYLVLMPFAKCGLPYAASQVIACAIATAGVAVLVRMKEVPLVVRAMIPFSYFIVFQYAVVARSYVMYPLLFFLLAGCYRDRRRYLGRFTILLILIANVSTHGLFIASGIYGLHLFESIVKLRELDLTERRRQLLWLTLFVANGIFLILILSPPPDLLFGHRVDFEFNPVKMCNLMWFNLIVNFNNFIPFSLLLQLTMLVWLWQRRLLGLALTTNLMIGVINMIYFNTWHEGITVVNWMFLVLAGFHAEPQRNVPVKAFDTIFTSLVVILLVIQCNWGLRSIHYEINSSYSGAEEVAHYLEDHKMLDKRIAGINFNAIAVNGFFSKDIFINHVQEGYAYWSWAKDNPWYYRIKNEPRLVLTQKLNALFAYDPDVIIVGLKFVSDREIIGNIMAQKKYKMALLAPGMIFWKDIAWENDSYVVFERE